MINVFKTIYQYPKRFLFYLLIPISLIWALTEPALAFMPDLPLRGFKLYCGLLLISSIFAIIKMIPVKNAIIKIKHSNTTIRITFGDIFSMHGFKVIPVNEFFDCDLGIHVSESSLHGKLLKDILGGQTELFCSEVNESLRGVAYENVFRSSGQNKKYPIGTTALLNIHQTKYFLVALAKTDVLTLKAKATVADLMLALEGLWTKVRITGNGNEISIPLMGAGLSNIGLSSNDLIKVIIISIIAETKKERIAENINIVLHPSLIEEIDLSSIIEEF